MSDQLLPHPLAALRTGLGLTGEQYLDRLDHVHFALGYGRMAKGRQKVSRWENGVNSPELPARYAMGRLHRIPRATPSPSWDGPISCCSPSLMTVPFSTAPGPWRVPWQQ